VCSRVKHFVFVFVQAWKTFYAPSLQCLNHVTLQLSLSLSLSLVLMLNVLQKNHKKPAVVLWLTFPESSAVVSPARQAAQRNLTSAGILTVVPAGFASTAPGSVDPLDACSIPVAASELALSVSATDKQDAAASGAMVHLQLSNACCHALLRTPLSVNTCWVAAYRLQ
jgi:hypothetical protein